MVTAASPAASPELGLPSSEGTPSRRQREPRGWGRCEGSQVSLGGRGHNAQRICKAGTVGASASLQPLPASISHAMWLRFLKINLSDEDVKTAHSVWRKVLETVCCLVSGECGLARRARGSRRWGRAPGPGGPRSWAAPDCQARGLGFGLSARLFPSFCVYFVYHHYVLGGGEHLGSLARCRSPA